MLLTSSRSIPLRPAARSLAAGKRWKSGKSVKSGKSANPEIKNPPKIETPLYPKFNPDNLRSLLIGEHTRVIYQGFTGRVATANAKESIAWGTKVVGGVKPGTDGEHLGLPICPSVRVAKEQLKPDATAIYVPGGGAAAAIEEAIEAEIPLIVAVAEHIPVHDMLRVSIPIAPLRYIPLLTLPG